MSSHVHPTAEVSPRATLGPGCRIWNNAQIREGAALGEGCIVGKDAYIDLDVQIGARCKIQNGVYLYKGVVLEDGVFMGPRATTTNDLRPRAIAPSGAPLGIADWTITPTRICRGAAIGAGAIVVCGVTVGAFAMVAAGAVVTRDVPPLGLVMGNPARLRGGVCPCGARLQRCDLDVTDAASGAAVCQACGQRVTLPAEVKACL